MSLQSGQLSPLQLELLKVYSFAPSEQELIEIKQMLATYFADRLVKKIDQGVEDQGISETDIESWLKEE